MFRERPAPLRTSFMLIAIVGFFLSYFLVFRKGLYEWGISFMMVFAIMLIAALVSMNDTEVESILHIGRHKHHDSQEPVKAVKAKKTKKVK